MGTPLASLSLSPSSEPRAEGMGGQTRATGVIQAAGGLSQQDPGHSDSVTANPGPT